MIAIRPWKFSDAAFVISVRNNPELMKWFRQKYTLTKKDQLYYMNFNHDYHGYIILDGRKRVGVVANHNEELCIAAPFKYHADAIKLLEHAEKPKRLYGDVIYGNPMLNTYLSQGFKIKSVRIEKCVS